VGPAPTLRPVSVFTERWHLANGETESRASLPLPARGKVNQPFHRTRSCRTLRPFFSRTNANESGGCYESLASGGARFRGIVELAYRGKGASVHCEMGRSQCSRQTGRFLPQPLWLLLFSAVSLMVGTAAGRFLFADHTFDELAVLPGADSGTVDIYILAGQSNMEGAAPVPQPMVTTPLVSAFVFGKDYNWYQAREPIATVGLRHSRFAHWRSPGGYGPSMQFAKTLLELSPNTNAIGLVMAARAGTNIEEWQRSHRNGSLYNEMLERALAASAVGTIRGVLFFQGESDAEGDPNDHPSDWATWFERFARDIRMDLGMRDLPIVFAQLGPSSGHAAEMVKAQQASVCIPGVTMIKTDDLEYLQGEIHFTASSYDQIGRRFAVALVHGGVDGCTPR